MGERDLGPFSPVPGTYPGRGGSNNGYFYGKTQTNIAGLRQARLSYLESVQCAISHPNTWESMTLGHFGPFQAPIKALGYDNDMVHWTLSGWIGLTWSRPAMLV